MKKIALVVVVVLVANLVVPAVVFAGGPGCPSKWAPGGIWPEGTRHSNGVLICRGGKWVNETSTMATTTVTIQDFRPTGVVNDTAKAAVGGSGCLSKWAPNGVWPEGTRHSNGVLVCRNGRWVNETSTMTTIPLIGAVAVSQLDGPLPGVADLIALGMVAAALLLSQGTIPRAPDHILNHPSGDTTSRLKEATWNVVMSAWFGGQPPDWCGQREKDGAVAVLYYSLGILRSSGKGVHRGLALILNGKTGSSTSIWDIRAGADGSPRNLDGFNKIPCPPPFSPVY